MYSGGKEWQYSPFPADFTEITDSKNGCGLYSDAEGTYTLGENSGSKQLLFTPAYNPFDPKIPPSSSRLQLPEELKLPGDNRLAVLPVPQNPCYTDLFICGGGALYCYFYNNQEDLAVPVRVVKSSLLTDIKALYAFTSNSKVYVWALNGSKELVYLFANVNEYSYPGAWGVISLLKDNLDYACPTSAGNTNALFAYTGNGEGLLGTESASGLWEFNRVFESIKDGKPALVTSYITLIKTDAPETEVELKTNENATLEINDKVYTFTGNPIRVKSNLNGQIRVSELAVSMNAAKIEMISDGNDRMTITPSDKLAERLFDLNTGDKLRNAEIRSQNGQTTKLIPNSVRKEDTDAAAGLIQRLKDSAQNQRPANISGIQVQVSRAGLMELPLEEDFSRMVVRGNNLVYSPEDVFGYMRAMRRTLAENDIFDIVVGFFEDAWRFIVKIGEKIVSFVIDCVEKAVACVVEVFNLIATAIEKIIDFLKYVFDIDDILLVRDVIKKIVNVSRNDMKGKLKEIKGKLGEAFEELDDLIAQWGDISKIGDLGGLAEQTLTKVDNNSEYTNNRDDVHANFLLNSVTENAQGVSLLSFSMPPDFTAKTEGELERLIKILEGLYEGEKEVVERLVARMKNEFFNDETMGNMDILTILKKLVAIIGMALVEGVREIADALFDLVIFAVDVIYDMLNQDLYIPCVSEFLDFCGIGKFSVLDVGCLIPAFIASVIYKLIAGKALVSHELRDKIMSINSLEDLKNITAANKDEKFSRELFLSFKIIIGVASIGECIFSGINKAAGEKTFVLAVLSVVCSLIDGAFYLGTGLFLYSPLSEEISILLKGMFAVIKYGTFFMMPIYWYYAKKKEDAKATWWKKSFRGIYAITSGVSAIFNITCCIYIANKDGLDEKERTAFYLDTTSLIPDNLRNVADGVIEWFTPPETGLPFGVALAARSLSGVVYGALQIAEGAYVNKNI
jgi:hypothetical protein